MRTDRVTPAVAGLLGRLRRERRAEVPSGEALRYFGGEAMWAWPGQRGRERRTDAGHQLGRTPFRLLRPSGSSFVRGGNAPRSKVTDHNRVEPNIKTLCLSPILPCSQGQPGNTFRPSRPKRESAARAF